MSPKVSVILPSYNHERFIKKAIDSVINQTYTDFELLVSDDASTDRTVDIVRQLNDPRIRMVHQFETNQGAGPNGRYLLERCEGEYIALINSDDVWLPTHLEEEVQYLDNHPQCGAVFSWAGLIDEDDNVIVENCDVFKQPNRTRAQWLRHFFTKANCLCHPSILIRKTAYKQVGFYRLAMRQLPDFHMWIRLIKHFDIHIIPKVLVLHRRCIKSMQNTSAAIPENSIRDVNEALYVLLHFLDDIPDSLFVEAFHDLFRNKAASTPTQLMCERFFLLADGHFYLPGISHLAAMYFFFDHCDSMEIVEVLDKEYHYHLNDFYKVGSKIDLLGIRSVSAVTPNTAPDPLMNFRTPAPKSLRNLAKFLLGDSSAYHFVSQTFHRIKGRMHH